MGRVDRHWNRVLKRFHAVEYEDGEQIVTKFATEADRQAYVEFIEDLIIDGGGLHDPDLTKVINQVNRNQQ